MYRYLEGYNITITNLGSRDCPLTLYLQQPCERAEPMSLIHQLVLEEASNHPDGIIILSGTDVANTDFGMLSLEDRQSRREVYASSLRSLINATLSANRYIAVSSPGTVLGEGPWYIPSGLNSLLASPSLISQFPSLFPRRRRINIPLPLLTHYMSLGTYLQVPPFPSNSLISLSPSRVSPFPH